VLTGHPDVDPLDGHLMLTTKWEIARINSASNASEKRVDKLALDERFSPKVTVHNSKHLWPNLALLPTR
jgi:hypothetical protein